ncbi:hypothetical protein SAMN05192569_10697 [Parageobacillus thermantarcticus]|uniref:Phage-Barnase-EndoU-ColicinE5/D-RelE like nuclease 3 domain-containing protein n=1 Tax=Parageobacillus thermantarcticus TaxID=186116 RepID=A0A1I0TWY0_9BACL|nr:hypothetical protein [Parageobacillus thermantarcticus]SFA56113.1 hypothetical protein SAMN05192569_10697 [Parageobacillus thermantarcticus]
MCKEKAKGEYIFTTTDPLGRMVALKQTTWNMHVIDGDHYRPEFIGQEETIKGIIEDPKFIVKDPIENRERYYDIVHLTSNNKIKPVMVVVDHSTDIGDVCTIFSISRMRETGERGIIYVRPKRK